MKTVKFGRTKVKVGDCVSVPSIYFGAAYLAALQGNGLSEDKLYGHVTQVLRGNSSFVVKWDLEQDETTMSLDKVTYEGEGIPLQQVEPQGTSLEAADTHALLVENDLEDVSSDSASPSPSCTLFVMSTLGKIKKNCLLATRVPCESGLKSTQGKFLIQEVLDEWDAFDADLHSAGTYVIWDLDCVDVEDSEVVRFH